MSRPVYPFLHHDWVSISMVQAAGPVVRAVMFPNELIDSGHSSIGPSALVFLVRSRVSCVTELFIFLSDEDEVPRPQPRKRPKWSYAPLCPTLGVSSSVRLCMFLELMIASCKREFCANKGHFGVK